MADKQALVPTPSAGNPNISSKTSTGNTKYYMKEVLREYENDKNYEQAFEECKDLLAAKGKLATSVYGISNPGPVVSFKEENITEEHRTYKPNLAQILMDACKKRIKNSTLAWREYIDCIKKHEYAQEVLLSQSTLDGQGGGEKTPDITQDIKGSDYVDSQNDNLQNTVDGSQQTCPEQASIDPANTVKADEQPPKENEDQKQTLTLLVLLDKDEHKDVDEFEEAHQDFVHMFTCQAVLRSSFPHANVLQHVTVNIDKAEDVPEDVRERALYRYLTNLKPETFDGHYSDIWREYGTLLMAENLLDLARKANGPDQNLYVVVRKTQFYEMQSELQLKTQEVEELSTRLSKFASQQLTEGNPNIADLSDTHRPTRLGEMYSQLFDDEWSEAFEAFKDSTIAKEGDDDDELYPNILSILQTLVTEAFSFCREKSCEQLQELENKIKEALRQNTADTPQTKTADSEEKMEVDQSPPEAGDNKVEKPSQGALDQTVERHSKELRKAASAETVKYQAQIFIKERLPKVLQDDKVRQDQRVISYVLKCVELCWFMNVQDPPMELVAPKEGEDVDKNLFSHHGRKGKKVQTCVWAALLLHKEGPVVCKGYILPKPK